MNDCLFCRLGAEVGEIVASNEDCLALARREPVLRGSVVIVPRAHRRTVFDLTPGEWAATGEILAVVKRQLDESLKPAGYNVGWNAGAVAGQGIEHCHLHVIPRFGDEPYAGRGFRYWLKQEENRRPGAR